MSKAATSPTNRPPIEESSPPDSTPTTPPAIRHINPAHLWNTGEYGPDSYNHTRIEIAVEGGQFLAALLMQHGADADSDGGNRLTACPNWTAGIGAAISAVFDSISAAQSDLARRA